MAEAFKPGDVVVSTNTGTHVRVTALSPDGQWFAGIANPHMPENFQYSWHDWRVSSFISAQ